MITIHEHECLWNDSSSRGKFYTVAVVEYSGDYFVLMNWGAGMGSTAGLTSGQLKAQWCGNSKQSAINFAALKVSAKFKRDYVRVQPSTGVVFSTRIKSAMLTSLPPNYTPGSAPMKVSAPTSKKPVWVVEPGAPRTDVQEYCHTVSQLMSGSIDEALLQAQAMREQRDRIIAGAAQVEEAFDLFQQSLRSRLNKEVAQ